MSHPHLRHNHPTFVHVPEPIPVSPLIRLARWSALGFGVVYGFFRLRQISENHAMVREFEFERKYAAAKAKVNEKKWLSREEMRYLLQAVGIPFNEGVAQMGLESLYRED